MNSPLRGFLLALLTSVLHLMRWLEDCEHGRRLAARKGTYTETTLVLSSDMTLPLQAAVDEASGATSPPVSAAQSPSLRGLEERKTATSVSPQKRKAGTSDHTVMVTLSELSHALLPVLCSCTRLLQPPSASDDDNKSGGAIGQDARQAALSHPLFHVVSTLIPVCLSNLWGHSDGSATGLAAASAERSFRRDYLSPFRKDNTVEWFLSQLVSTPHTQAHTAQRILQLLLELADQPRGAEYLVHHAAMTYIINFNMIRPAAPSSGSMDNAHFTRSGVPLAPYIAPSQAAGNSDSGAGGSPRTQRADMDAVGGAMLERNGWHSVWCVVVALVRHLTRHLANNEPYLRQVVEFAVVYELRLARALSLLVDPQDVPLKHSTQYTVTFARLVDDDRGRGG